MFGFEKDAASRCGVEEHWHDAARGSAAAARGAAGGHLNEFAYSDSGGKSDMQGGMRRRRVTFARALHVEIDVEAVPVAEGGRYEVNLHVVGLQLRLKT